MQHAKPLDWAAVLASPVPLKVVASCLDTLQPIILEDFKSAADLSTCLRASANVPEARNPRITALAPNADSFTCLRASAKVLKARRSLAPVVLLSPSYPLLGLAHVASHTMDDKGLTEYHNKRKAT